MSDKLLPVGTRIRFPRQLDGDSDDHSPAKIYAYAGELGEITGHGTREGYWTKADHWPHPFGAAREEFEVVEDEK